jgi:hypothetical protein
MEKTFLPNVFPSGAEARIISKRFYAALERRSSTVLHRFGSLSGSYQLSVSAFIS